MTVFPTQTHLVWVAAERIASVLQEGIHATGTASFVLSGGATPRSVYELLGTDEWRARVEWPKIHLFWGDERCVPPNAPDSNFRMANESLIRAVAIPAANVHRIPVEKPPQEAASLYQAEIRRVLQLRERELPRFTLVLLGLGEDGHVASLFPNSTALQERTKLAVQNFVESVRAPRITLTMPVINNAFNILFLVTGKAKAGILKAVVESDVPEFPANMVHPESGTVAWFVDADAASQLPSPSHK